MHDNASRSVNALATITPLSPLKRASLCGDVNDVSKLSALMDFPFSNVLSTAKRQKERACLRFGRDEWFLIGPDTDHMLTQGAHLVRDNNLTCSFVDISDRNSGFFIAGSKADFILNASCALDLSITEFPPQSCTRTLFGKAAVILWRKSDLEFHLECWRSFAPYVEHLLFAALRSNRKLLSTAAPSSARHQAE